MEPRVGCPVLVHHFVAEFERYHACDRRPVLERHANGCMLRQTFQNVAEPRERLRRQLMTAARLDHQFKKRVDQSIRSAFFVTELLSLAAPNLSDDVILMKDAEELSWISRQLEAVEKILGRRLEPRHRDAVARTQLDIL